METIKRLAKQSFFPLLIVVSLVVGWCIPGFYDWTGSDQSRPSPLILPIAMGLLLCGLLFCCVLPWMRIDYSPLQIKQVANAQFKIRTILIITALVAVILAVFKKTPVMAVSGCVHGLAICYVARKMFLAPATRIKLASLLACMYFPFAWTVSFSQFSSHVPAILGLASGLPAFFFVILLRGLVQQHFQELQWLSMLLTSAELLIGVWLVFLGPRRFAAYLVFVLLTSIYGSFILNALVRM